MGQALIVSRTFDANIKNPARSRLKAIDIYEVYNDPVGPYGEESLTHCTIGMFVGRNKAAVTGSTSLGVIKQKITAEKLTYGQLAWLDLGQNAGDIVKNMARLSRDELQERLDIACL